MSPVTPRCGRTSGMRTLRTTLSQILANNLKARHRGRQCICNRDTGISRFATNGVGCGGFFHNSVYRDEFAEPRSAPIVPSAMNSHQRRITKTYFLRGDLRIAHESLRQTVSTVFRSAACLAHRNHHDTRYHRVPWRTRSRW